MSTPAFWPFPMPVETPLGQGYMLYSVAQPMWENDTHLVLLDDGRLLHFSTNQLRGVQNGTYDIAPARPEVHAAEASGSTRSMCGREGPVTATEVPTCKACLNLLGRRLDAEPRPLANAIDALYPGWRPKP